MKKLIQIFGGFSLALAFQASAPAQTITSQPQSITINNASSATFTVGASNAMSYQWQFNGARLGNGGNITGATNSALTLEDVNTNEAGSYTVIVSNSTTAVTSYPPAVLTIVPGTIVTFNFSGLLSNAPGSNVQVQLFNHDKPATVRNFIQYITAGAYTNMFFDRCLPRFVLQGGDYGASNQTAATPPITGWSIEQQFTLNGTMAPPFQAQLTNEFKVGPLIHNRFGTMAMALVSGEPNSASSAFFFNLADNSTNLDPKSFTVFGRILDGTNALNSGTNVLNYFNTLGNGDIITNAAFLAGGSPITLSSLPVNYIGTNAPANSNLVYCHFQVMAPPGNTNLPAVSITSPTANAVLNNGSPFTAQGTAVDNNNIGLAWVRCDLIPLAALDGTLPNGGVSLTNYVLGATNWSMEFATVPPGMYELGAQARDEASNLSPEVFIQPVIVTAIVANGDGIVTFTNGAFTRLDAVGYPFQNGSNYDVVATAGTNQVFVSWTVVTSTDVNPEVTFTMSDGFLLSATFISNGIPDSIAFTYPAPDATISPGAFNITGTIANVPGNALTVTCQIYSTKTYMAAGPPLTTRGTNTWAVGVDGLPADSYAVEAIAVDGAGDSTAITENFTVAYAAALQLVIAGKGTVSPVTNGEILPLGANFQVTAMPGPGQAFYTWNNGTQISANATQTYTMASGLTLTATFIPSNTAKGISFTYPAAHARLTTNSFPLKGRLAPGFEPTAITCQVFQTNGLAAGPPLTTGGTTPWALTVTNLPGGNYIVEAMATNPAGMGAIISENFSVLAFAAVAGTYSGLFISTNSPVAPTNSGLLTFTVGPAGVFSGKLVFPAYAPVPIYPQVFTNIGYTTGFYSVNASEYVPEKPLSMVIYLDLNGGSDIAVGTIASKAWSAQLLCYRAVTKLSGKTTPATGKYVLSLQTGNQTNQPGTNGYAALVVGGGGTLALSGALPDNTTFSQSARVSKDGIWPLCAIPAGDRNNGILIGWETISASGSCSGQLHWHKAPHNGAYYTNGVDTTLNSAGTNFSRPAPGSRYSIVLEGGAIAPPLTNSLLVNEAGQFDPGSPADELKISLSANGVITGSVLNASDNKTLRFKGAFISPSQGGSGFIAAAGGQTGCFELKPAPP